MILPTENEAHGYFNTISEVADPQAAWHRAFAAIHAVTQCGPDEVRAFLDSRYGRHFADEVADFLRVEGDLERAVNKAVARWMGWRISANTARQYDIPRGLPYLTGFVVHAGLTA